MKILFVRPNQKSTFMLTPPLGLGYLSAAVKRDGHYSYLIDATLLELTPAQAAIKANHWKPDVIGIQVYTGSHWWVRDFINKYRKIGGEAFIVVGGHHVSALKDAALNFLGADVRVEGEGENGIRTIANRLKDGYKYGYYFSTPIDVNEIPIPDWQLLHPPNYFKYMQGANVPIRGKRPTTMIVSRGCPYNCTFCASHCVSGHRIRYRDHENVIREMKMLKKNYGIDEIFFNDDNLCFDNGWAEELFDRMISEKLNLHWRAGNGIRGDKLNDQLIKKMARSGCYFVGTGIESGSAVVRKAIKKNLHIQLLRYHVVVMRENGIMVSGFYIIGFPGETREQINESMQSAINIPFDRIQVGIFTPYPGSELYDDNPEPHSPKEIRALQKLQRRFFLRFYLRTHIIWSLIRNLTFSQLKMILTHPWIRQWFSRKKITFIGGK